MAINTIKPPVATPRANVPRPVIAPPAPEPEPLPVHEPEPEPVEEEAPRAPRPTRPRSSWSVFTLLERITRMDGLFREGLPVRYLPHVLFIMFLTLLYIGNTHYGYRMNRNIQKLKLETEDLRADYTTLKSDYMEASKQSEVARKVAAYGLVESSSPPFRITVPAGRLDEAELDKLPIITADSLAARAVRDSLAAVVADSVALAEGEVVTEVEE
ncbi:FtsL-like putative cell division protein [Hymenobacter radiodurans]|uniref:FtsL-like putative cell division protein n=1 Tax=Hymenobacter radiodurans TaxID=2496028 RepID=UPI00196B23A1|nr:FtsL-like putative cell division protein [Hymenobacter radiodurans]